MLSPGEYANKRRRELSRQRQRRYRERRFTQGTGTNVVCHGTNEGFGTGLAQTKRTEEERNEPKRN